MDFSGEVKPINVKALKKALDTGPSFKRRGGKIVCWIGAWIWRRGCRMRELRGSMISYSAMDD